MLQFVTQVIDDKYVEPLIIAAGGGGASDSPGPKGTGHGQADAQGIIHPRIVVRELRKWISIVDKDAGESEDYFSHQIRGRIIAPLP